jgi:hypothetical protein
MSLEERESKLLFGFPGLMGMEALETVVGYWEDALNAYQVTSKRMIVHQIMIYLIENQSNGIKLVISCSKANQNVKQRLLTTSEEAEFTKMLENILEAAYQLQVRKSFIIM